MTHSLIRLNKPSMVTSMVTTVLRWEANGRTGCWRACSTPRGGQVLGRHRRQDWGPRSMTANRQTRTRGFLPHDGAHRERACHHSHSSDGGPCARNDAVTAGSSPPQTSSLSGNSSGSTTAPGTWTTAASLPSFRSAVPAQGHPTASPNPTLPPSTLSTP